MNQVKQVKESDQICEKNEFLDFYMHQLNRKACIFSLLVKRIKHLFVRYFNAKLSCLLVTVTGGNDYIG